MGILLTQVFQGFKTALVVEHLQRWSDKTLKKNAAALLQF